MCRHAAATSSRELDSTLGDSSRSDFGRVQGVLPHDEVDATDPVGIGGRAKTSLPTAVADGDVVKTLHDVYGRIVVIPFGPPVVTADGTKGPESVAVLSPVDTVLIASPGTTNSIRVSSIYASNLDPTYSINLSVKEGSTTRVLSKLHLDGGGYVFSFEPDGWVLGANLALLGALNATYLTTGVQANVMYRVIPTP